MGIVWWATLSNLLIGGCVSQPTPLINKTIDVQPVIDYSPLGGFTEKRGEGLYILPGDASTVKKGLEALVTGESAPRTAFSQDETLNIVIFRGVFNTGGYDIKVDKVNIAGNALTVHATYTDPGPGLLVIQTFTQPTAIIPIGRLEKGGYEVKLMVTTILKGEEGDRILEEGREYGGISFTVK